MIITDYDLYIEKVWEKYNKQIGFLEEYYSDKAGYRIKIIYVRRERTSYFSRANGQIVISGWNLYRFLAKVPNLFYSMFYTLIMHEIGHALYTDRLLNVGIMNIIEDNRIEYQINLWNPRARFDIMRYVYQDTVIEDAELYSVQDVALALLRTINNTKYVEHFGNTPERKSIVKEVLELNEVFKKLDYQITDDDSGESRELKSIEEKIRTLLEKLLSEQETAPFGKEKEEKNNAGGSGDDSEEEENNAGGSDDDSEKETEDTIASNVGGSDDDSEEELEDTIASMISAGQLANKELDNQIGVLVNRNHKREQYRKHKVSSFTTARRAGIKGGSETRRYAGNAKELSLKSYARRNHVVNEKLFKKESGMGRGKKSARVLFYLDISGSMRGSYIENSIDYIRSFYDAMHKHLEIRLMCFGIHTYEITRKELDNGFLINRLEGGTSPKAVKLKPNEQIIFITDGAFETDLPKEYHRKANFVIISDIRAKGYYEQAFRWAKNTFFVNGANMVEGLEKATEGIKKLLRG